MPYLLRKSNLLFVYLINAIGHFWLPKYFATCLTPFTNRSP